MSVLKRIGKTLGTAALLTTGTASTVLKGVTDAVGLEIGSEILDAAKGASFNGVRAIWLDTDLEYMDKLENLDSTGETATRSGMARTARRAAEIAKRNGDME